jgi:uncharacterized protein YcbK (DUF882 family)
MIFDHYNDIPKSSWGLKYFKPFEIACKGTGEIFVNLHALNCLDNFRSLLGHPIQLSSAYRSIYHNSKIGGAPLSAHSVRGGASAFDVVLNGEDKEVIKSVAQKCGFKGFGMGYRTFVHIDIGRRRSW